MSIKAEVSSYYMKRLKDEHGHKVPPLEPRVLITGDNKAGSIGEAIRNSMPGQCTSYGSDVKLPAINGLSEFDALIMCHGAMHLDWIEDAPIDKLINCIDVNLTGTLRLVKKFVEDTYYSPSRKRIISIGSMAYKAVLNGSAAYCASKAGAAHLMKCLAWELAPKGYDVFIIHPSNVEGTPMTQETIIGLARYRKISLSDATNYWSDSNPRQRFLTTDEIAELVKFLLGPHSSYLSGAQLELAGGQR